MGLLTKQDIENFYQNYKNDEVIFTKEVSKFFGIQPKQIYIKFKEIQRPCIIYSSSMTTAKVIVSLPGNLLDRIKTESSVNLRFAIKNEDKKNDYLYFYTSCKTVSVSNYRPEQNLYIVNFSYSNEPPEALITLLGKLLEAKKNSSLRIDERIILDKESITKLGLLSASASISIDNIPRQGIIRDLSFGGIKILLVGNSKFLNNKAIKIILTHKDYGNLILLGKSIRADYLPNRKDIAVLAIQLDLKNIPIEYSLLINEYLKSQKVLNKIMSNIEANSKLEKVKENN
ncbi:MAG: hypothetical protein JXR48_15275 [Candidatus Delongbacteria bacterium]|nr:hypothetical protein [Candidatus Delongbacteria bacterium]MBN2836317.1 hypothetical protein [Candidatus Delongbacteria bacterium]